MLPPPIVIVVESTTDWQARWSYDRLRLMQPHILTSGLWELEGRYTAVVVGHLESAQTVDGKSLVEWFGTSCAAATCPIELATTEPVGATPVPDRTPSDLAAGVGDPVTVRDAQVRLLETLPRSFPSVYLGTRRPEGRGALVGDIRVTKPLTSDELESLRTALVSLALGISRFEVTVDPSAERTPFRYGVGDGDLHLLPSRWVTSEALREAVEEDEDQWLSIRDRVFADPEIRVADLLPEAFQTANSACLLDVGAFEGQNIRNFLTVYQTVHVVVPLESHHDAGLSSLGVSEDELVRLVETGRVKLVAPQAIDRYQTRLLDRVSSEVPGGLLLSRRLAAATVADARHRVPLLYPTLTTEQRQWTLRALSTAFVANRTGAGESSTLAMSIPALGEAWAEAESDLNAKGAMGTIRHGMGWVVGRMFEHARGGVPQIEFPFVGQVMDWAGALGAAYIPNETPGWGTGAHADVLASFMSGLPGRSIPQLGEQLGVVVGDLLAVDHTVDVVALAKSLQGGDIDRLRALVYRLLQNHGAEPGEVAEAVEGFNASVLAFERRQERLRRWDLSSASASVMADGALMLATDVTWWPGSSYVLTKMVNIMIRAGGENVTGEAVRDSLVAAVTGVRPSTVLVARTRSLVGTLNGGSPRV